MRNHYPLYLHLLSSLFIINRIFVNNDKSLILWLLLYLAAVILAELFSNKKIVVVLYIISLLIPYHFFNEFTFIYYGITATKIISVLNIINSIYSVIPFIIPIPFISKSEVFNYFILSGVLYILSKYIFEIKDKITKQENKIDKLEGEKQNLQKKINELKDFDNEKEYLLKLEERSKIAGKLHDEIGHTISGSIFQLEACNMIIDEDLTRAKKMINSVTDILNEGINSIRKSLKVIKPDSGQVGLENIKTQLKDFKVRTGIETKVTASKDLNKINNGIWGVIRDNTKEFLTNTLKYSGADIVTLNIEVLKGIITARLYNNGKSVDVIVPGLGLRGMEERVNQENGTLIVDGSNGFTVSMIFRR